jgi:hypothetical protein
MACALGSRCSVNVGVASLGSEADCQILSDVHAHTLSRLTMRGRIETAESGREGCSQTSRAGKPELGLGKV